MLAINPNRVSQSVLVWNKEVEMRIVEGISSAAAVSFDTSRRRVAPPQHSSEDHTAAVSRTLITLEPAQSHQHLPRIMGRPVAAFVAHLIATERQEPQTRLRR